MEIWQTIVVLPPSRCPIASYTLSYCLLDVVVLPSTRCRIVFYTLSYCLLHVVLLSPTRCRISPYTLSYCLLHVAVLLPTRCRITYYTLSYCLLHVDVACFTNTGFCSVFQRFVPIIFTFTWGIYVKHETAMMIGLSPELEMALYTLCFKARPNRGCNVTLAGKTFTIRTGVFRSRLRSAFFHL